MSHMDFVEKIKAHEAAVAQLREALVPTIQQMAEICREAICAGHKIMLCGNGGSAADSQHIAAEFVGHFSKVRRGLPSIALTTDTSILTAVGNDDGYEEVFRRQVEALAQPGDVLIGISTSGNSVNVVKAFEQAKQQGVHVLAFTGSMESKMSALADVTLFIPSTVTARIQECHILVGHLICDYIDEDY
jgi:D-sedoheptulose 7-phosphate isomerase